MIEINNQADLMLAFFYGMAEVPEEVAGITTALAEAIDALDMGDAYMTFVEAMCD